MSDLLEEAAAMIMKLSDRLESRLEEVAVLQSHIEMLEAEANKDAVRLKEDTDIMTKAADRIEALEGALREIKDQYLTPDQSSAIAKAALAPEQDK